MTQPSIARAWISATRLIGDHRDVLDARVWNGAVPEALARRGWDHFLLSLDDEHLVAVETAGIEADLQDAPAGLHELVMRAREVCTLAPLTSLRTTHGALERGETPRKRLQIEAFSELVRSVAAESSQVVDVGSGHGHLTREIARSIERPVVGLERNEQFTARARALQRELMHREKSLGALSFLDSDVTRDGIALTMKDCVIGLHACGELGDMMVESAALASSSIALIGCCLQKRRAPSRAFLATPPQKEQTSNLDYTPADLPKALLGLSNLTAREDGVERSRNENIAGRRRRLALYRMLSERGVKLDPGAELSGLNRRAAHAELETIAARAFSHRGLPLPDPSEIEAADRWSRIHHERARRLSLPRALLARSIEVAVLLDRALHLEQHGYAMRVGTAFPSSVSARNLALLGAPPR